LVSDVRHIARSRPTRSFDTHMWSDTDEAPLAKHGRARGLASDASLQGRERLDEIVRTEHGHPADALAKILLCSAPVVGEGDVRAVPVRHEVVAPEPTAELGIARVVELARHPPDGTVL